MTTDEDLTEQIARALRQATDDGADRTEDYAAAVLPIIRKAQAEAWDECVDEAEGSGWIHDYAVRETYARNPYRGEQETP